MNSKVDWFFNKPTKWQEEVKTLRSIVLECNLVEELKWGNPCYTYENSNIVLIHMFKDYCALLFFKGALMMDPKKILIQQTENVQSARQIRFTGLEQIAKMRKTIQSYIYNAIEVEESGAKIELKPTRDFKMPEEFRVKLKEKPALQKAFESLTPGRQRGYLLYFSSAKQAKTREERVKKYLPKIMKGKGLEDSDGE